MNPTSQVHRFRFRAALLIAGLIAAMTGCGPSNRVLTIDGAFLSGGQSTTVEMDGTLTIRLRGTGGSSYSWRLADAAGQNGVLTLEGRVTEHDTDGRMLRAGGTTWDVFTFAANHTGTARLRFVYDRAWEPETKPVRQYNLDVEVTQ
ncbi:MAG: protease inhibitor I42 family protein [Phycisphaerales bacterium]|nr:protease inhibitor I42 family protein [Phycisphaerales bacterium]MCI0632174.1 protease inhibitor I42 family protein [Phycisphaerales bacterium]